MECGYAITRKAPCMHCQRPITFRSLQVGVEVDDGWGLVTRWSHPACARIDRAEELVGFDDLDPADQEALRLLSESDRKRQRHSEPQPEPAAPAVVEALPHPPEAQWTRGCFGACPLDNDGGDEHLLHHLTRLEQAYRSRLPPSLAEAEHVGFNLAHGRPGAQARLAMLFDAPARKERLGEESAKAVFKALAGPNPQGQCWKGWRQSGFGETQVSGPRAAVRHAEAIVAAYSGLWGCDAVCEGVPTTILRPPKSSALAAHVDSGALRRPALQP